VTATSLLTIGIPTYDRAGAVLQRVAELLALPDELDLRVLVIDNASPDGTAERVAAAFSDRRLRVLRNESNLGYSGNFLRLIEEARTEYLMVVSDEDEVLEGGLVTLISYCRDERPRFVAPRAQVGDNTAYRGRRRTRPIEADEFESASFYVSGLTFAVDDVRASAAVVAALVPDNPVAALYPQVLLSALAVEAGGSDFVDALVTRQVTELESRIVAPGGAPYRFVPGRWAQFEGFETFFRMLAEQRPESAAKIDSMRAALRESLLGRLEAAAIAQYPELAGSLHPVDRRSRLRRAVGAFLSR